MMSQIWKPSRTAFALCVSMGSVLLGCGGTDADKVGIASTCGKTSDCPTAIIDGDEAQLTCLTQFDAGYCAIEDCKTALDCPVGATCVAHEDGQNYCFRQCREKIECNANRPPDSEANCAANFDFASPADDDGLKACIPPSSG